ncbi:MAG: cell division protein FtsA [bacterium]
MSRNIIAGLDLGTTKVCAVIAEIENNKVNILGFGVSQSEGLTKGLVANINKTAAAIKIAMDIAVNRAGVEVKELYVGVAGEHIKSLRYRNYVTISNSEHEITEEDIERLKADIKTVSVPADRKILHIIPEEYIIDGQGGFEDPIGITGTKLEAVSHVVLASVAALNNIKKSVERAGYFVKDYMLQPIASSLSVLEENEKDLGVCLIDIGGGTTDIAVYHNKSIRDTSVIGIAGNQVTNDIRETLGLVSSDAERLKIDHGYALEEAIIKEEDIYIRSVGGRGNVKIPITLLTQIINARMKELFQIIDKELRDKKLKSHLLAGVVITGGGALLKGCDELAQSVFGFPARIGVPLDLGIGLSHEIEKPEFATVAGLIKPIPGVSNVTATFANYEDKSINNIELPTVSKKEKLTEKKDKVKKELPKTVQNVYDKIKKFINEL